MPEHSFLRLRGLSWWIALAISGSPFNALADDTIQFDGRFLDLKGNTKIDLGRFSQKGYVEPGKYNLRVHVNNQPLPDDYDIGNDSNLLIVFYVQIMPDDFVMQLHRF